MKGDGNNGVSLYGSHCRLALIYRYIDCREE